MRPLCDMANYPNHSSVGGNLDLKKNNGERRQDRNHWRHQLVNTITVRFLVTSKYGPTQMVIVILRKLENL